MLANHGLDVFRAAPYGVYAVDLSQVIMFWNRSAERILGHIEDEVVGLRCFEVLQGLPENGTEPVCLDGCPSIRHTRTGHIPPVVRVMARCASGERRLIVVTPLVVEAARSRILVHLFHDDAGDSQARSLANRVSGMIPPATEHTDASTNLTTDSTAQEVKPLTIRELEVLRLTALGFQTRQMAYELSLSTHTVLNHVRNARAKLHARTKLEAVLTAKRLGLI